MTPHVAILIPSAGQRGLANLARDAIAKFTTDVSHEVWLLDTAPDVIHGSQANGRALDRLIQAATVSWALGAKPTHVFCMHDDVLPLRAGWLSYLLAQPGPVVGVKASERNGYAHSSGVLFDAEFAVTHSMLPDLPRRDAGEWPANSMMASICHRPGKHEWPRAPQWWHPFSCDLSVDNEGNVLFIHLGGGTLNSRPDTAAWIAAAREALDL